jgi:hypothetical protein
MQMSRFETRRICLQDPARSLQSETLHHFKYVIVCPKSWCDTFYHEWHQKATPQKHMSRTTIASSYNEIHVSLCGNQPRKSCASSKTAHTSSREDLVLAFPSSRNHGMGFPYFGHRTPAFLFSRAHVFRSHSPLRSLKGRQQTRRPGLDVCPRCWFEEKHVSRCSVLRGVSDA